MLWARRVGQNGWQFPQGGIREDEEPEEALYRELYEELGLTPDCVEILGSTKAWLKYDLPRRYVRRNTAPVCIGQKQRWYLLALRSSEAAVCLDAYETPEFDDWRWINYWRPYREVIFFKRNVYRRALEELAPLLGLDRRRRRSSGPSSRKRQPQFSGPRNLVSP